MPNFEVILETKIIKNRTKNEVWKSYLLFTIFSHIFSDFGSMLAPFWLHFENFGSILDTLDPKNCRFPLRGTPGGSTGALWFHFGSILAPFWLNFDSIWIKI